MSEEEKQAKLDVVKELLEMARAAMADGVKDGLDGMASRKVEVSADSPEGLEEGLDKAQELVSQLPESEEQEAEEGPEHEASETPEMEAAEHEDDEDEEEKPKKRPLFDMF